MNSNVAMTSRTLVLLSFTAFFLMCIFGLSSEVLGIQIWLSDETGFDFHSSEYATNEVIYVTGEWDVYDFPCPIGDVYLVPNSGITYGSSTIFISSFVTVKPIQGCGGSGAFFGAILKLPPLPLGEYDIVMDENQDWFYNGGTDYVLGDGSAYALKVIDEMLDQDVDVAAIKADAEAKAQQYRDIAFSFKATFFVIGVVSSATDAASLAISVGSRWGYAYAIVCAAGEAKPIPTSYNGAVMSTGGKLINAICINTASVYQAIANDPPDPNYNVFVPLDSISYEEEISTDVLTNRTVRLSNNFAQQSALGGAFLQSYEKFLGAEGATDYGYSLLQARYAREYCGLLIDVMGSALVHLDSLEAAVIATGWADSVFSADAARSFQQRVIDNGFNTDEINAMRDAGLIDSEIDTAGIMITDMDLTELADNSYFGLIDSLRGRTTKAIADFSDVALEFDGVLDRLRYAWTGHPEAVISCKDTVTEGEYFSLDGLSSTDPQNDSLVHGWDLEMDGQFDDNENDSLLHMIDCHGEYIIGLRVMDPSNNFDVGYKRIIVQEANRIPSFTTVNPEMLYVVIEASGSQIFSYSAHDPDDDPLESIWYVDDEEMGTGTSYVYQPGDTGVHHVIVRISDGSPLSPDNYYSWRVKVNPTQSGIEDDHDAVPLCFRLEQNYPNPFNPFTTIAFDIKEKTEVSLAIYDVTGGLVRVLKSEMLPAGHYEVIWDGKNEAGAYVSSGIYLCNLRVGAYVETKKMVLLR